MTDILNVYLGEHKVGNLELIRLGQLQFSYSDNWLSSAPCIPISLSLPLQKVPFDDRVTRVWFANLLPEGRIRESIAKRFGISVSNEFAMLESIGRDCAGAISIWPNGEYETREPKQELIKKQDLAKLISDHKIPLLITNSDEVRLSLAGAQEKLPLIYRNEKFYLAKGGAASTHILKPPIDNLEDSVCNEVFCMQLASACGLTTASTKAIKLAENVEVALIERFDRIQKREEVIRIHQEDFCQALGFSPDYKYQSEGGPSLLNCVEAIREWSIQPGKDVKALIDWIVFNVFIGNCDAHAKNIGFLFTENGPKLAPFYDLISTRVYENLSDKLAMSIGGENRIDWLQERHWERFADEINVKPKFIFDRLVNMRERILVAYKKLCGEHENAAISKKINSHIVAVVNRMSGYR